MSTTLGHAKLQRILARLPSNSSRRFDPQKLMEGDAPSAAKAVAREAVYHGGEGDWWRVWRELQREAGRPLSDALSDLPPEGRRWFALWSMKRGDVGEGLDSYRLFLDNPGKFHPLERENELFLEKLIQAGHLPEALSVVDRLAEDAADAPNEQSLVAVALIDGGDAEAALKRIGPVRDRFHDFGKTWAVTALAYSASGRELDARRTMTEAAKLGVFDDSLRRRLAEVFGRSWLDAVAAQREAGTLDFDSQQRAWLANPGALLEPTSDLSPHTYGGTLWRMPPCRGCGHSIQAWFTLDVQAIAPLQALLPGWRFLPLLGCADCMVWMGRHDYEIDPIEREVRLLNVAIETKEYGKAYSTTPAIAPQPASVNWTLPVLKPTDDDLEKNPPPGPQVAGCPSWTQGPVRVYCPACRNEMAFVAAMATPEGFKTSMPINNESGYQYHFACCRCRRISVIAQWT